MMDSSDKKPINEMEKTSSKDNLEMIMFEGLLIGLLSLIFQAFIAMPYLLNNPINTIYLIGNILINTFGKMPLFLLIAVSCFLIVAVAAIGLYIGDEKDMQLYEKLLYIFWGIDSLIILPFGMYVLYHPALDPLFAALLFLFFIAPPLMFFPVSNLLNLFKRNKK
jgi:nitrate reductase NapE component